MGQPETVENFIETDLFANLLESKYLNLFELLVNSKRKSIDAEDRTLLLHFVISLYFRNPKLLHFLHGTDNEILDLVISQNPPDAHIARFEFNGTSHEFERQKDGEFRKIWKKEGKLDWLETILNCWLKVAKVKENASIQVVEIEGPLDLITSDNPVTVVNPTPIRGMMPTSESELWLPISPRHLLIVLGNDALGSPNEISRITENEIFALIANMKVHRNAERWLLGKGEALVANFASQNAPNYCSAMVRRLFASLGRPWEFERGQPNVSMR
jgi:hypothetical protein